MDDAEKLEALRELVADGNWPAVADLHRRGEITGEQIREVTPVK